MADTEQVDLLTQQTDRVAEKVNHLTEKAKRQVRKSDRLTEKSQWSNWTVLAMLMLCFFVVVRFRPFNAFRARGQAVAGKQLPQLKLRPLTGGGQPVEMTDLTGRVVLVHFWGTWSSKCPEDLGLIAKMDRQFRHESGFRLLSVSCGRGAREDIPTLRRETEALLREQNINMPVYADPGGVSRSAVDRAVGLRRMPTTLVVDRRGRIRGVWEGFGTGAEREIQQMITQLLAAG